jgi:hypothetical protein
MKSDPNNANSTSAKARAMRARLFGSLVERVVARDPMRGRVRILDIGGTVNFWRLNAVYMPASLIESIEVVNIPPVDEEDVVIEGIRIIAYGGDALDVKTLRASQYDIVHSNSVIEHVGNLSDQKLFADIVRKISRHHFIQTPCLWFPIEPHFYFPFFALLPLWLRTALFQHFRLGFMGIERDWLQSRIRCEATRLMTRRELRHVFPGSECLPEFMFCMVKSWMVTNMDVV